MSRNDVGSPVEPPGQRQRPESPFQLITSRQLLRKLLDRQRFVFYPMVRGKARWYDLGVTPTLDPFFGAVSQLEKAVASPPGHTRLYFEGPLLA